MLFAKNCLYPTLIHVPGLGDCDEIIWISTKPKYLPRSYTNLITCSFYYSPGQNACSHCNIHDRLQTSLDFVTTKCPNAGIFIAGDTNELSLNYLCKDQKLKQIVEYPTTKSGTGLDIICNNLKAFLKKSVVKGFDIKCYHFPVFLLMNAESLNYEKLLELEATAILNHINIIAVTEVQAQNPYLLKMTAFQKYIKLHQVDHPLGKKGGGVLIFAKNAYLLPLSICQDKVIAMKSFGYLLSPNACLGLTLI